MLIPRNAAKNSYFGKENSYYGYFIKKVWIDDLPEAKNGTGFSALLSHDLGLILEPTLEMINYTFLDIVNNRIEFFSEKHKKAFSKTDPYKAKCYRAHTAMKQRCLNPNNPSYRYYGARGIKICDRWLESYNNFENDMGLPSELSLELDRIDNNGNYEPSNCRWVTKEINLKNRRTFKGLYLRITKEEYERIKRN